MKGEKMNKLVPEQIQECNEILKDAGKISFGTHKELPHLMPTVFGKNGNENFISDWLAFILNPAVNSVGVQPLNLLLELLDNGDAGIVLSDSAETDMGNTGEYSSCRECYLDGDNDNRIDLLFKVEDGDEKYLFAIENKVYAGPSKNNQLGEYNKAKVKGFMLDKVRKEFEEIYKDNNLI